MSGYNNQIFAANLRKLLEDTGTTQRDIARLLDVSSSTVSNWCTGQKVPRMGKIELLAEHFGILKSDLIEEKERPAEDGRPVELTREEWQLILKYRHAPDTIKKVVDKIIDD